MTAEIDQRDRGSRFTSTPAGVTVTGLIGNAVLALAKVAAGLYCHSQAILADGLHTASDCATDIAVLAGIRITGRPADAEHPYGHSRAGALVTVLLAALLLGTGTYVAYNALQTFSDPHEVEPIRVAWPLALALVTVAFKEGLFHATRRVARRRGNLSLLANAWHHRSDAFSSIAAAGGLAGVAVGGARWQFLDHVTALLLACFLLVVATRLIREAVAELMDHAPTPAVTQRIAAAVAETPGVTSFHAFRARRLGGKVEMDIHVQVNPQLTVREGHDIASLVRARVQDADPDVLSVIVHVEPVEE